MHPRLPPPEFVAALQREFPDFIELRFNDAVQRWEFVFRSAAGIEVSQFYGWEKNPLTGAVIQPDGMTGLLPFRDLDENAQREIIDNCKRTFIGNREDGAGTWKEQAKQRNAHNKAISRQSAKQRAEDYAYALQQVDLRRPWVKYHQRNTGPAIIIPVS